MEVHTERVTAQLRRMLEQFISGQYDPLDFSYDFPDDLCNVFDEVEKEDPRIAEILDDNLPEICAEYERGMDPQPFIDAVRKEYERAFPA